MFRKIFAFLLFLLVSVAVFAAQNAYFTIKVGNFKNPKIEDFQSVRALGYVYAERMQDEIYEVYVGRFDDQASAQDVAEQIKKQGYLGAKVEAKAVEEGELVTVVQIATKSLGEVPNWEKFTQAGPLHSILTTNQVKYVTGPYKTMDEARQQLGKAKRTGFSDAFIKNVNTVFLHRVTPFEMSGVKQELIPIAFDNTGDTPITTADKTKVNSTPVATTPTPIPPAIDLPTAETEATTTEQTAKAAADATQQSFEGVMPDRLIAKARDLANPVVPTIRTNVKRRSVLNLQAALKGGGFYQSSVDGLYGKGTANAYVKAKEQHRQLQKYSILAQYMDYSVADENESQLQKAINNLAEDPFTAKTILAKSEAPTARTYLAYLNFINKGASALVNNLMNRAIQDAFRGGKKIPNVAFDPSATYAYNDLDQLLLHLRYVQAMDATETATPCWLFINHPKEIANAYANPKAGNYTIQNCGGFDSWREIQTVQAIATDLNATNKLNTSLLAEGAAERTQLFIAPKAYSAAESAELEKWNVDLWKAMDTWAKSDPVPQQMVAALKVSYFHSQVLLEDYFMDRGFNVDEAKGLALAVMQSVVDYHLERFQ
ncbi:MAG: SPOR domain-containing protein [Saprospiraceae bacterium]